MVEFIRNSLAKEFSLFYQFPKSWHTHQVAKICPFHISKSMSFHENTSKSSLHPCIYFEIQITTLLPAFFLHATDWQELQLSYFRNVVLCLSRPLSLRHQNRGIYYYINSSSTQTLQTTVWNASELKVFWLCEYFWYLRTVNNGCSLTKTKYMPEVWSRITFAISHIWKIGFVQSVRHHLIYRIYKTKSQIYINW